MQSTWDVAAAVRHLNANAKPRSSGYCARYTRQAIEAGGLAIRAVRSAHSYGPGLVAAGFVALDFCPLAYVAGDVVVFDAVLPKHPHGHMAMYNGTNWVSDFVQRTIYVSDAYRRSNRYTIYRHPDAEA